MVAAVSESDVRFWQAWSVAAAASMAMLILSAAAAQRPTASHVLACALPTQ